MDAKAFLEVGRTIPCPIIFHLTVLRPENALIHAILRNTHLFFRSIETSPFPKASNKTGDPKLSEIARVLQLQVQEAVGF